MGRLIRTLLVWMLVLAVPAQGTAALTMAFCGPDHHGGMAAVQAQAAAAEPMQHGHHAGGAHEHGEMAASADDDTAAAANAAAHAQAGHGKSKCSACASCCSLSALPSTVLHVPMPVFTATVYAAVVPSVDSFAADGPDRPPRTFLA